MSPLKKSVLNLNIATVRIQNDQLIINGSNLTGVTTIKLIEGGSEQVLTVESITNNEIVANGIAAISLGVGKVFDMVLSNANAAATFPVSFTLNDGSVTAVKLAPMGALSGQVLKFNGTNWAPASLIDAQLYKGTWDPATLLPDVGLSSPGDYWVVSAAGTNAGDGITYAIGDWIISDGYSWSKLALSKTSVTSFNGRKGLVNLVPGDYPNLKSGAKIPGSNLNDLANVDITTVAPNTNDVLKFNGTNWVAGAGAAGAVGSTEITDLSITGADIAENTINLSKLYSPSIDAALYLRGDKTWANFTAEVLNAPLSTYALDATVKPTVAVTDKIGPALGKIQKYLNDLNTDYISKTAAAQVVSGTFSFTSPTSFLYTQLPTGASPTEVSNVQYVQNYVGAALSGISSSAPATLTTANGGATAGDTTLTVVSTSGYPSAGTLLVGSEAISYTGTTGTTFTGLTRGAYGTTAAIIANGATINNYLLLSRSTTTATPKMVVTGAGNVGIGTSNPLSRLHIDNGGYNSLYVGDSGGNSFAGTGYMAKFYGAAGGGSQMAIGVRDSTTGAETYLSSINTGGTGTGAIGTHSNSPFVFRTNNTTRMTIDSSGNVGIGTTTPAEKLDVNGALKLGNTSNSNAGTIRWDGTNFQGYTGSAWSNFVPNPPASGSCDTTNTYSTAGTYAYTVPASFGTIKIKLWGGGGSGSGVGGLNAYGGSGSASTISSLALSAGGGSRGQSATAGSGGTATGGDISTNGISGANGLSPNGGAGGSSPNGGAGGAATAGSGFVAGSNGQSPGGGGSGALFTGGPEFDGGGGGGAYVEKTFTTATLPPGTTINDIVVGAGGVATTWPGTPMGGSGAIGKVTVICASAGAPITNDRGIVFMNGGNYTTTTNFIYDSSGNVGIGTPAPSEKLHVVGNLRVQGSTDCTLGNGAGGTNCSSDIRLKENIQAIKDPLHKILSLRGVEFDWNEKSNSPGRHDIGVIAQDIEKVFPTAVFQDPTTGFKKVDYAVLVAPIIQAFKQINKFISELFKASEDHTRDIALLKNENSAMKVKLETDNATLKNKFDEKTRKLEAETFALRKENEFLKAKLEKIEKFLEKNK